MKPTTRVSALFVTACVAGLGIRSALSGPDAGPGPEGVEVAAAPSPALIAPAPRSTLGELPAPGAYLPGRVMVAPVAGASLEAVARAHGARVAEAAGRSGYGALDTDGSVTDLMMGLSGDPRVADAAPVGRIEGTGRPGPAADDLVALQWHLAAARVPDDAPDLSGWVVAVLDSGLSPDAPSLSAVERVAPWDFVNGDADAADDHQHGTHVASVIASSGAVRGVAPGVSLMPLKVLGADNSGSELGLVEALHHAVDAGADVINMSLSFRLGYVPSKALSDALRRASDAGVVLVAASGNDASDVLTWPAASALVLGVGATRPIDLRRREHVATGYTNLSTGLDLVAPGGSLEADLTGDGLPDGILAETIALGDPSRLGYWLYAGSSQAAAITSGAAVRLLDAGVPADDVGAALQRSAFHRGPDADSILDGFGLGDLDVGAADQRGWRPVERSTGRYDVALLPFLADGGDGTVAPSVRVTVSDAAGAAPGVPLVIYGDLVGPGGGAWSCRPDVSGPAAGACTFTGPSVPAHEAAAWVFTADAVYGDGHTRRPGAVLPSAPSLRAVEALGDALADTVVAFSWPYGSDAELGPMSAAYVLVDLGHAGASTPVAVVIAPSLVREASDALMLDVDGTGLASTPLGFVSLSRVLIGGTGLASTPLGLRSVRLLSFGGTGLASTPLGLYRFELKLSALGADDEAVELRR